MRFRKRSPNRPYGPPVTAVNGIDGAPFDECGRRNEQREDSNMLNKRRKREKLPDYIDEIAKTGISRVVSYGDAFFVDGKLTYHPERRTVLIKPTADERTFEVLQP